VRTVNFGNNKNTSSGPLIDRLGGLDALLSQGALSAGERQLICIARAVLTNAGVSGRGVGCFFIYYYFRTYLEIPKNLMLLAKQKTCFCFYFDDTLVEYFGSKLLKIYFAMIVLTIFICYMR
jgi:hypothetical protein